MSNLHLNDGIKTRQNIMDIPTVLARQNLSIPVIPVRSERILSCDAWTSSYENGKSAVIISNNYISGTKNNE